MDPIFVIGHRNPDTDSIVAAIAYAALRNALGNREYQAACLGQISDETWRLLDRFGFQPPKQVFNMYTQVQDLEYDKPPVLSDAVTVGRAWSILEENKSMDSLAVARDDGTIYGLLSRDDIARFHMELVSSSYLRPVPLFNLLSVLEGNLLHDGGEKSDIIGGEVTIALPQAQQETPPFHQNSIVVCGQQPDMIRQALERNVNCLILCQAELDEEFRQTDSMTCIISTPYDAYRALRLIFQSAPVGRICRRQELLCFHTYDRVDDVREQLLKHRGHSFPVLDENEQVVGLLGRNHLLRPKRKRVVLVDHNEAAQSVAGLEEAEILEIIDHHRLADIQTVNPIFVRNEPVGSTNTIIASMFQERGLMPSMKLAGLIAAAIVSDTVMFKSPTCTEKDRRMAERMARTANLSLDELGKFIFSSATEHKSVKELLAADCKEFHIAGYDLSISQITCVDSEAMLARKEEFLFQMRQIKREKNYDMVLLMLTDVLIEGTQLLFAGEDEVICQAFNVQPKDAVCFLPGIMSRKKQVVPSLSVLWG